MVVTLEPEMVWLGVGETKETRGTSRARARFMDLLCGVTIITVKGLVGIDDEYGTCYSSFNCGL